ncbi:MAG: DUF6265 family protein [Paludibaculum sp.]
MRKLLLLLLPAALFGADANQLNWMAGCWTSQSGPLRIDEQWSLPVGGMMLGLSRTVKQDRTVFHEFMRIETRQGVITYTPRIGSAQAPVAFTLIKQTADEVVFENLAHDFPQRILYRRTPNGLAARIEGSRDGKEKAEDFPMQRTSCESR